MKWSWWTRHCLHTESTMNTNDKFKIKMYMSMKSKAKFAQVLLLLELLLLLLPLRYFPQFDNGHNSRSSISSSSRVPSLDPRLLPSRSRSICVGCILVFIFSILNLNLFLAFATHGTIKSWRTQVQCSRRIRLIDFMMLAWQCFDVIHCWRRMQQMLCARVGNWSRSTINYGMVSHMQRKTLYNSCQSPYYHINFMRILISSIKFTPIQTTFRFILHHSLPVCLSFAVCSLSFENWFLISCRFWVSLSLANAVNPSQPASSFISVEPSSVQFVNFTRCSVHLIWCSIQCNAVPFKAVWFRFSSCQFNLVQSSLLSWQVVQLIFERLGKSTIKLVVHAWGHGGQNDNGVQPHPSICIVKARAWSMESKHFIQLG